MFKKGKTKILLKLTKILAILTFIFFLINESKIKLWYLGGRFTSEKLKDYSGFRESSQSYYSFTPKNSEEASEIIKFAYKKNIPIRFCGKNQSRNGFSLPKKSEYLIKTQNMANLEFLDENKIRVGAGPNILHVNGVLRLFNLQLPLVHGGPPGPSVGGFISAGGFGLNSDEEGGFWENVFEVTLVVGNGKVLKLKQGDKIFPWIFGSMGQLGLITEAVLKVIPIKDGGGNKIPIGKTLNLNSKEYYTKWKETSSDKPLFWLNFFATKKIADRGRGDLEKLREEFKDLFEGSEFVRYEREIKYKNFNPPLIFHEGQPFMVQVLWGYLKSKVIPSQLAFLDKKAFFLAQKYGYRRYVQTEFNNIPEMFKLNWGSDYTQFYNLKAKLDPKFLFSQGLFEKSN
jgi:hypothetical protein